MNQETTLAIVEFKNGKFVDLPQEIRDNYAYEIAVPFITGRVMVFREAVHREIVTNAMEKQNREITRFYTSHAVEICGVEGLESLLAHYRKFWHVKDETVKLRVYEDGRCLNFEVVKGA